MKGRVQGDRPARHGWTGPGEARAGAILAVAGFVLAACTERLPAAEVSDPYVGTALEGTAGDFELTDQTGTRQRLSQFRGNVIVLTFFDSRCTDVCPLTAIELKRTYEMLTPQEAGSVEFLAVNVNTEASSVEVITAATKKWRLDEIHSFHFLTGAEVELRPIWDVYHITVYRPPDQADELLHTPGAFLIDQVGELRWYVSTPFNESGQAEWTAPLSELLIEHIQSLLREG